MARHSMTINISGAKKIERYFEELAKGDGSIERMLDDSMGRIQLGAFKKAPVLTGLLSSSLVATENVRKNSSKTEIVVELIESIPYATRQEFENRRKPAFIRTSTDEEFPTITRSFEQWAKSLGGR